MVKAAAAAGVDLLQIREKNLSDRVLYSLAQAAVELTRGTATRVFVNDRADIASAAGANGVHLTSKSLPANIIRKTFGPDLLIGASTHSLAELTQAKNRGADFAVFGPVFETKSKAGYGDPVGLEMLREAATAVAPFPVLALGGIDLENASDCINAGASGIAAIGLFDDPDLGSVVDELRQRFAK